MLSRKPKVRSAGIYQRQGQFLVQPDDQTIYGVYIGGSPILRLPEDVSDPELGTALSEALKRGKSGVPHPTDWKRVGQPLYDAASVKSWGTFLRGTLYCSASDDGSQLRLIPSHNGGTRDAFQHLNDKALTLPSSSPPEEIGAAIREALARSD